MNFISEIQDFPEKIRSCITENYGSPASNFVFGFKTAYKPNPTIPLLWFVLLKDKIVFCNTHKTRGIYKEFSKESVNSLRLAPGALNIQIISNNLAEDDFSVAMEKGFEFSSLKEKLIANGYEVI